MSDITPSEVSQLEALMQRRGSSKIIDKIKDLKRRQQDVANSRSIKRASQRNLKAAKQNAMLEASLLYQFMPEEAKFHAPFSKALTELITTVSNLMNFTFEARNRQVDQEMIKEGILTAVMQTEPTFANLEVLEALVSAENTGTEDHVSKNIELRALRSSIGRYLQLISNKFIEQHGDNPKQLQSKMERIKNGIYIRLNLHGDKKYRENQWATQWEVEKRLGRKLQCLIHIPESSRGPELRAVLPAVAAFRTPLELWIDAVAPSVFWSMQIGVKKGPAAKHNTVVEYKEGDGFTGEMSQIGKGLDVVLERPCFFMLHKKSIYICCLEAVERGTKMASAPKENRLLEMASASGLSTVRQPEGTEEETPLQPIPNCVISRRGKQWELSTDTDLAVFTVLRIE